MLDLQFHNLYQNMINDLNQVVPSVQLTWFFRTAKVHKYFLKQTF